MLDILFRTVTIYLSVLLLIRIMGKREIGQLSAFDLVVAIMIAELAAIPMDNTDIPLHIGMFPIIILVAAEIILSKISLKSEKLRAFINGTPSVVVEKGVIVQDEMAKLRLNLNDLLSQIRQQKVANIDDIEYAIMETSGKLSVILKPDKQPIIREDIGIHKPSKGLPMALITDGHLSQQNLNRANKTVSWLMDQLKQQGYTSISEIFLASLDEQDNLFISEKHNRNTINKPKK